MKAHLCCMCNIGFLSHQVDCSCSWLSAVWESRAGFCLFKNRLPPFCVLRHHRTVNVVLSHVENDLTLKNPYLLNVRPRKKLEKCNVQGSSRAAVVWFSMVSMVGVVTGVGQPKPPAALERWARVVLKGQTWAAQPVVGAEHRGC